MGGLHIRESVGYNRILKMEFLMLNSENVDLILSTVAVILDPGPDMPNITISDEALTHILRRPLNVASAPGGQFLIASNRDQIEVQLFPNKIDVRNVSGRAEQGEERIPRIINEFLSLLGNPTLASYGINFAVELKKDDARNWLATNLLNPLLRELVGPDFSSNQASLIIEVPPKQLTVQFGVRSEDQLHVNFNASEDAGGLPSIEQLTEELRGQFSGLIGMLHDLEVI